ERSRRPGADLQADLSCRAAGAGRLRDRQRGRPRRVGPPGRRRVGGDPEAPPRLRRRRSVNPVSVALVAAFAVLAVANWVAVAPERPDGKQVALTKTAATIVLVAIAA